MKIFLVVLLSMSISSAFGYNTTVEIPQGAIEPGCKANPCFIPQTIFIQKGNTVTWQNNDYASHSVTSGTSSTGPDGLFDISSITRSKSNFITFDQGGSYAYYCVYHPWMTGTITVVEELPQWLDNVFEWYDDELISQSELQNSFKFLITNKIITI